MCEALSGMRSRVNAAHYTLIEMRLQEVCCFFVLGRHGCSVPTKVSQQVTCTFIVYVSSHLNYLLAKLQISNSHSAESIIPDTAQLRKERGAFFTPPEICHFLVDWAVRSKTDTILEPSCGEAEFMLSAASRLRLLGGTASQSRTNLQGIEIHEPSAGAAMQILQKAGFDCDIRVIDFFDVPARPIYDVVLGNPPFVDRKSTRLN